MNETPVILAQCGGQFVACYGAAGHRVIDSRTGAVLHHSACPGTPRKCVGVFRRLLRDVRRWYSRALEGSAN